MTLQLTPVVEIGELAPIWDAVIVGAGPAGAAAAIRAAACGVRVLLLDRVVFPRGKVCGCCVSPRGLTQLDELGVGCEVARLGVGIDAIEIMARGRSALVPMATGGVAVSREALDSLLVRRAAASGATVLEGVVATLAGYEHDCALIRLTSSHATTQVRARAVIVADGLSGTFLPKNELWQPRVAARSLIGIGARVTTRVDGDAAWPRAGLVRMYCARGGYVGVVGLEDHSHDVAAAVMPAYVREVGGAGDAVGAIMREATRSRGIEGAIEELRFVRWHGVPRLTRRRDVEHGTIVVAGDAAGYVEPFSGEGISWALRGGLAAAGHVQRLLSGRAPPGAWRRRYRDIFRSQHLACSALAMCLRSPGLVSGLATMAGRSSVLCSLMMRVLARNWSAPVGVEAAT